MALSSIANQPNFFDDSELTEEQQNAKFFIFDELLPDILHHVPTQDLIRWRLVSKRWLKISDKILYNRPSTTTISFQYHPVHQTYYRVFKTFKTFLTPPTRGLQYFNDLASNWMTKSNRPFFRPHYEFDGGNLDCQDAQDFFSLLGPSIKQLTLRFYLLSSYTIHNTSLEVFGHILSTHLPSLESLTIRSLPYEWATITETPPGFLEGGLPQLKKLDLTETKSFREYPVFMAKMAAAAIKTKIII